ncbi:MAG: type VI secretion system Vgr family protein, partial [Planctomycetota bacterium]
MKKESITFVTFESKSVDLAPDTFIVTSVEGTEEIGKPYRFEIELLSKDPNIEGEVIMKNPAALNLKQGVKFREKRDLRVESRKGVVAEFEQRGRRDPWTIYRAVLVPPLWQLSLSHQTRIFQNLSIPNLINEVLKSSGIPINAFDISKLSREEVKRDYTVQHDETDLDFLQRWLEHEGISYWFEDTDQGVKIIFGEQSVHFPQLKGTVSYSHMDNPDDLEKEIEGDFDWYDAGHVVSFNSCRIVVPKTLVLRDYNWQTPSESLEVKKEIYQEGFGIHYEYNNHYQTLMEGVRLGDIRKQEILSRQTVFQGKGTSRLFRAGLVFNLTDHYRDSFNDRHLLTKVVHTAKQEVALA